MVACVRVCVCVRVCGCTSVCARTASQPEAGKKPAPERGGIEDLLDLESEEEVVECVAGEEEELLGNGGYRGLEGTAEIGRKRGRGKAAGAGKATKDVHALYRITREEAKGLEDVLTEWLREYGERKGLRSTYTVLNSNEVRNGERLVGREEGRGVPEWVIEERRWSEDGEPKECG